MTEKEKKELRALYLKRAKREIAEGNLEVAGRAILNVKALSGGDGGNDDGVCDQ